MPATQMLSACSKPQRGRRKRLFINPGFQWRYAAVIAGGVFAVTTLMCSVMYGVLYEQARARTLYLAPSNVWENTISLVLFAGVFALIMSAAFALWGVIVSHRICGPLFVMERSFRELAMGKLPQLRKLRRKDEFQTFYATMGGAVDRLRDQRHQQIAVVSEVLALVHAAQTGEEMVRAQALASLRERMTALHQDMATSLDEDGFHAPLPESTTPSIEPVRQREPASVA